MPSITGRVEVNLTVRDLDRSAVWYGELLGMEERYDFTSTDGSMRYVSLVEPISVRPRPAHPWQDDHPGHRRRIAGRRVGRSNRRMAGDYGQLRRLDEHSGHYRQGGSQGSGGSDAAGSHIDPIRRWQRLGYLQEMR